MNHVADDPQQVLTPEGVREPNSVLDPYLKDVDAEMLAKLYTEMRTVRRFDEEAFALTRQGQLVLWAPLLGQEAAQVGSLRALSNDDWIFGSYREHAAPLLRGADIAKWLKTWKAHEYDSWDPHQIKVANMQIIIGAQTLHAVGYAMAAKQRGLDDIAVTYFGDGATSEGDVSEALVFASTYQAPTIFICQNNGYAISEPVDVQAKYPLYWRARGFDIPTMRVDGNDVLAMLASTRIAAERARLGKGPTFIEAMTYRVGPHTTTDDPSKYRNKEEEAAWRERDPISRLERYLEKQFEGLGESFAEIRDEADKKADAIAAQMRAGISDVQPGNARNMFDSVYVQETSRIAKQRAQHNMFIDSLAGSDSSNGGE